MFSVFFGLDKNALGYPDAYFSSVYEPKWFNDPFVKEMVKGIDNCDVLSENCIQSPILGQIPPDMLSGGVKACIMLYMEEDVLIDLIACGPNCEPWLEKIFASKDLVKVTMSGYDLTFLESTNFKGICENDNSSICNWEDWCIKMGDMVESYVR